LIFFQGGYGAFAAPSLVAAGQDDILEQLRVTELVRGRLTALSDELGVQAVAVGATMAQLVILGSAGQPEPGTPPARLGHRMPLMAPAGGLFVAWNTDSAVDSWLEHRGVLGEGERNEFLSKLSTIRSRGWSLALSDDAHLQLEDAIGKLADGGKPELDSGVIEKTASLGRQYDPPTLSENGNHVRLISAPIFGAAGQVVLTISLWGLPQPMTSAQVEHHAVVLRTTADAATEELGGRVPSVFV
jgi:DNA-binding IclR family transcriptional regulator